MAKSPKFPLGATVIFAAATNHLTTTKRGDAELSGSIHHPELAEFAATVGRVRADGTYDLALTIPGHSTVTWVNSVAAGDGPGQCRAA